MPEYTYKNVCEKCGRCYRHCVTACRGRLAVTGTCVICDHPTKETTMPQPNEEYSYVFAVPVLTYTDHSITFRKSAAAMISFTVENIAENKRDEILKDIGRIHAGAMEDFDMAVVMYLKGLGIG